MRPDEAKHLLNQVESGAISPEDALDALQLVPVADLGYAQIDMHRELRLGLPEAIFGEGKTAAEIAGIATRMLRDTTGPVLATRVSEDKAATLRAGFADAEHYERARLIVFRKEAIPHKGHIAVVCAGTSDLPVAEEATHTARALGAEVDEIRDVGVAGVHRTLAVQDRLRDAAVVIVVAGMEGALPSLIAGLTPAPVVAVPTSVGYGAAFEGLSALLGMLNSCASGVAVMNIDNGFGAAYFAMRTLVHSQR